MIKHNRIFVTLAATVILTIALTGCGKTKEQNKVVDNSKPQKETTAKTPEKATETSKTPVAKEGYVTTYPEKDLSSFTPDSNFTAEDRKIAYLAAKFVFDDLTKKFENKETLTVTDAEGILAFGTPYDGTTSMICDLSTLVPADEGGEYPRTWDRKAYEKFIGFDVGDTSAVRTEYAGMNTVDIDLKSNPTFSAHNDEFACTLFELVVKVSVNDDGTFTYQSIRFDASSDFWER